MVVSYKVLRASLSSSWASLVAGGRGPLNWREHDELDGVRELEYCVAAAGCPCGSSGCGIGRILSFSGF